MVKLVQLLTTSVTMLMPIIMFIKVVKESGVAKKDIQPPLNFRLVACLESQIFML